MSCGGWDWPDEVRHPSGLPGSPTASQAPATRASWAMLAGQFDEHRGWGTHGRRDPQVRPSNGRGSDVTAASDGHLGVDPTCCAWWKCRSPRLGHSHRAGRGRSPSHDDDQAGRRSVRTPRGAGGRRSAGVWLPKASPGSGRPLRDHVLADMGPTLLKERPPAGDDTAPGGPPFPKTAGHLASKLSTATSAASRWSLDDPAGLGRRLQILWPARMFWCTTTDTAAWRSGAWGFEQLAPDHQGLVYAAISGFGSGAGAGLANATYWRRPPGLIFAHRPARRPDLRRRHRRRQTGLHARSGHPGSVARVAGPHRPGAIGGGGSAHPY